MCIYFNINVVKGVIFVWEAADNLRRDVKPKLYKLQFWKELSSNESYIEITVFSMVIEQIEVHSLLFKAVHVFLNW